MTNWIHRVRRAGLPLMLLMAMGGALAAPQYRVQVLYSGPPQQPATASRALSITPAGQVLVQQWTQNSWARATHLCDAASGACRWVSGFADATQQDVQGFAVNAAGWVTGGGFRANHTLAFLNDGQAVRAIGAMRGRCDGCGLALDSVGYAINSTGVVAGAAQFEAGAPVRAFLRLDDEFRDLGTLGGQFSEARAINDRGDVAGHATLAGDDRQHAVLWSRDAAIDLGTLGGASSWAYGLNRHGTVVGCSERADGLPMTAFIWRADGGMQPIALRGQGEACALAINGGGSVVGYAARAPGALSVAVRYRDGRVADLNRLLEPASGAGWQLVEATAINAQGQIAGNGFYKGLWRAFVLTPIRPSP